MATLFPPRGALSACVPALSALLLCSSAGSATPAYLPLHGVATPPDPLPPVAQEQPSLQQSPAARRRVEVSLGAQAATKLCPPDAPHCAIQPGWRTTLSISSRPWPHLAWGLAASVTEYSERFQYADQRAEVAHRALGAELSTKLFFLDHSAWDPYFSLGFGGGQHSSSGRLLSLSERGATEFDGTAWAPSLSAAMGVDAVVGENLRLGSEFTWIHWMIDAQERCGQVMFGMCSVAGWRQFTPYNAVWAVGLSATLLFGTPH